MYKKSYKGFVVWMIAFLAGMVAICFLSVKDENVLMRLIMLLTSWYMAGLSFHVWRTERVYWYNGTTFEAAEAAGPERRKMFAWRHFRIFGGFALLMTVLSCTMQLLGWSAWIDFAVGSVGICVACFMTIPIKL